MPILQLFFVSGKIFPNGREAQNREKCSITSKLWNYVPYSVDSKCSQNRVLIFAKLNFSCTFFKCNITDQLFQTF